MLQIDKRIKPYCVVVGGINIDIQAFCHSEYIERDSNPGYIKRSLGGVGRNIAENLVRLGLQTEMITILGDSPGWKKLISHTEHAGIGLGHSPCLPTVPLPTYLCILERDGGLVGAVADMRAIEQMQIDHLEKQKPLLDEAAAIIVDGNIPQTCIEWLAERYNANGDRASFNVNTAHKNRDATKPLLVADPVSSSKAERFKSCFGKFDIAKPNIAEAAVIAGVETKDSLQNIISAMRKASNLPGELYVSMGEKGMEVIEHNSMTNISLPFPKLRPHSINHSGAGDAACAALVWISIYERIIARELKRKPGNLCPQDKAKMALASALYAASSKYSVNPKLNDDRLCETAANCYPELSEIIDDIRHGGEM
ncbi:MAG: PfkB family carbohydrate kinase [Syntrophaceae bacterium]